MCTNQPASLWKVVGRMVCSTSTDTHARRRKAGVIHICTAHTQASHACALQGLRWDHGGNNICMHVLTSNLHHAASSGAQHEQHAIMYSLLCGGAQHCGALFNTSFGARLQPNAKNNHARHSNTRTSMPSNPCLLLLVLDACAGPCPHSAPTTYFVCSNTTSSV